MNATTVSFVLLRANWGRLGWRAMSWRIQHYLVLQKGARRQQCTAPPRDWEKAVFRQKSGINHINVLQIA